jgi:hypothetical protein
MKVESTALVQNDMQKDLEDMKKQQQITDRKIDKLLTALNVAWGSRWYSGIQL